MKCCMGKMGGAASAGIPTEMAETKIEKVDAVFNDAKAALQAAEDLRAGLEDSKATCMALSGAYTLKEGNMSDALALFMWSVGAEMGAEKLAAIKPSIDVVKGSFDIELDPSVSDENKEFLEAFQCWVMTVAGAVDSITEMTTKMTDCSTKASELSGTIASDAAEAGLSAMDKVKAAKNCASNAATIAKATAKLAELGKLAPKALEDMKSIATGLTGTMTDAVKNVNEGKEKSCKKMGEFAEKQHSKEKLKPEESKKDASKASYDARIAAGKKLPSKKAAADKEEKAAPASAAEAAAPAEEEKKEEDEVKPEDVKPEVKDV